MPASLFSLGSIRLESGRLICIDLAAVRLWQHAAPPVLPSAWADPQSVQASRAAQEYRLEGPQAVEIAEQLGWPHCRGILFDVTPELVQQLQAQLAAIAAESVSLVPLPDRITHRQRVELAVESASGAGEIFFHTAQAFVLGDLPTQQSLRIAAQRCAEPDFAQRWQRVEVALPTEGEEAESQLLGTVAAATGTLLLLDVEALPDWEQEHSADGKADLLCWGPDIEPLAQAAAIPEIEEGQFGWLDLPLAQIEETAKSVQQMAAEHSWRFSSEVLTHTHPFLLKRFLAASGWAEFEIGGTQAFAFETTWGDGSFEIYRDSDASGQPIALRLELGTAERMEQFRRAERRAEEFYKSAVVTKAVLDGEPVGWLYREPPQNWRDSGWRVFVGSETEEELAQPNAITLETLHELCRADPSLEKVFWSPIGSAFRRLGAEAEFEAVSAR